MNKKCKRFVKIKIFSYLWSLKQHSSRLPAAGDCGKIGK